LALRRARQRTLRKPLILVGTEVSINFRMTSTSLPTEVLGSLQ
jgi:hypothetical protein